jgi:hypothetical protein
MDYHSPIVNNCVSLDHARNYLRLNLCFAFAMALLCVQSVAVFLLALNSPEETPSVPSQWALLFLAIPSGLSALLAFANSAFSCYLRVKCMTRIGYRFRETDSNNSDFSDSDPVSPGRTDQSDLRS